MPIFLLLLLLPMVAAASVPRVTILTIDGAITPATADYFVQGLRRSAENGSSLVVLEIDTPGGLDTAMRDINKAILASPVPVAAYVYPSGARAASAGTYILYASHVAAMAPGTNLGAATPVQIGLGAPANEPLPSSGGAAKDAESGKATASPAARPSAMEEKQVHDSAAYMRSLAQLRGRNSEWGERAVREAVSLSADEALKAHVVDYVAHDVRDLLDRAQGSRLTVGSREVTLEVAGAELVALEPDWRSRLLAVIASPSLALVLMMLGIYGLLFEFTNPGYVLPGVVGGISLLLALFAFQMLPVSYTGLGLIVLGMAFLVAEVYLPTSGALGVGGILAFAIGAVILFEPGAAGYGIPIALIATLACISAIFVFVIVRLALQARRRPVVSGQSTLFDSPGEVLTDFAVDGWATIHGEIWRVRSDRPLARGARVRVTGIDGATLVVEPQSAESKGGAS